MHCSYVDGSNRKQVLTYTGKEYKNGLPDANGQVVNLLTKEKLC